MGCRVQGVLGRVGTFAWVYRGCGRAQCGVLVHMCTVLLGRGTQVVYEVRGEMGTHGLRSPGAVVWGPRGVHVVWWLRALAGAERWCMKVWVWVRCTIGAGPRRHGALVRRSAGSGIGVCGDRGMDAAGGAHGCARVQG